jgi:hypothetical protein
MCDIIVWVAHDPDCCEYPAASSRVQEPLSPGWLVLYSSVVEGGNQTGKENPLVAEEHEDFARVYASRNQVTARLGYRSPR